MKLKPYTAYKDSGIEWLGEIPAHWEVKRLKSLGLVRYGLGQPPREKEGGLPIIRATNVSRGEITPEKLLFVDPNDLPYNRNPILKENDIIVVRSGAYTGDSAIIPSKYNGSVAGYDMVFTPINVNPKFISYSLVSNYVYKDQLVLTSLRAAQPHLNKEELNSSKLLIPPIQEQKQIANYLDQQTGQIDKKISLFQAKIEQYQALKKSLINETVCRGLDKTVQLKDSGIEWIGEIPKHWEVRRGKDVLEIKYGIPLNSKLFSNNAIEGFPMIRIRDLIKNITQTYYLGTVDYNGVIDTGAILTGMDGDFNTVKWSFGKALLNQRICEFKTTKVSNRNFLFYYLPLILSVINSTKHFTTVKHLSDADLKKIIVLVPPIQEQKQIANYLDQQTGTIDKIIANLAQQIEQLQALGKSLINEVVTGKVQVSTAVQAKQD